jgi:hypothetical protein
VGNQHTWPQYTIDDPEKFAELIIESIREIVWSNKEWCDNHPQLTIEDMVVGIDCEICQDFGVKE